MRAPRANGFAQRAYTWVVVVALACAGLTVATSGTIADAATYHGSAARTRLTHPIVGMAPTPTGDGYWLVASDGGIFSYGDAHFYGSTGNIRLKQPIVGIASSRSGKGYWLVARDGGIFTFGDAHFYGSTGNLALVKPVVGMARTRSGHGYWLVASDGGVFSFGDADFYGSTGNIRLKRPITGMARTRSGHGYWMVASDGGIFSFGDAHFRGSTGGVALPAPIKGMASDPVAEGYWMLRSDGRVYSFGHAAKLGSAIGMLGGQAAVGISPAPEGGGFWIASQWGGVDSASSKGMRIDPNLIPRNGAEAIRFELIRRINTERLARNLHPLFIDPLLSSYSASWASHLAGTHTFTHQDLMTILRSANGRLEQAGENLFAGAGPGARDAGTAHYALMLSDPHRANILVPEERLIGVGAACLNGELVVVEDFATPAGIPLASHPEPGLQPFAATDQGGSAC